MSDVRILNDCELLYQNKYLFDLCAPKKVCGPREVIRSILGYVNVPMCQKRRHEIISTSCHYIIPFDIYKLCLRRNYQYSR